MFSNWFDFADDTLTEISTRFDRDVYSIVEFIWRIIGQAAWRTGKV